MRMRMERESEATGEIVKARAGEYTSRNRPTTKSIVEIAMFTAVIAILSQISIPLPSGVPITFQTFVIALAGVVLTWRCAVASTVVYILIGAVGVPVFAGFSGGVQILANYSGGFIWGFLFLAALCGVGSMMENKKLGLLFGMAGLVICHAFGVAQFMLVMKTGFVESFVLVSAPYLVKDALSVIFAFIIGRQIRSRLLKEGLLSDAKRKGI